MAWETRAVAPVGKREAMALVKRGAACCNGGCALERVEVDVYPDAPVAEAMRLARIGNLVSLRDLATRLGMSPVDLSALEHGRREFVNHQDYERVMALLGNTAASTATTPRGEG